MIERRTKKSSSCITPPILHFSSNWLIGNDDMNCIGDSLFWKVMMYLLLPPMIFSTVSRATQWPGCSAWKSLGFLRIFCRLILQTSLRLLSASFSASLCWLKERKKYVALCSSKVYGQLFWFSVRLTSKCELYFY